jgi:hypothetical protein
MITGKTAGLKEKAKEEVRLLLWITAYLAAFFVAFLTYRRLISREFGVTSFRYGFALIEAVIIAKVILIGKAIGVGKKTSGRASSFEVLRLSVLYAILVAIFSILEHVVEGLIHRRTFAASFEELLSQGIYEIFGKVLVMFVAFIPFFAIWELDRLLGERKLFDLFFRKGTARTG